MSAATITFFHSRGIHTVLNSLSGNKNRLSLIVDSTNFNAIEFGECLIACFYSKIPLKILYLLTCVPCSYFLWFPTSIFDKVWRNSHLFGWKSCAWLTQNVNAFAFLLCQIFVVDHSKTSSFFLLKPAVKSFFATVSPLFIIFEKLKF
jgi:hypothetical protein